MLDNYMQKVYITFGTLSVMPECGVNLTQRYMLLFMFFYYFRPTIL